MKENDLRFARWLVLVNAAVPLALLGWDAWHHQLGANPVNFAILTTGLMALIFLLLTAAGHPAAKNQRLEIELDYFLPADAGALRLLLRQPAFPHFLLLRQIVQRVEHLVVKCSNTEISLLVGITGLIVMVPLAVTSTNAMIKRLGGKRWRALHRLAYVAAIAGVIHYYLQTKADVRHPLAFAAVLAILLGYRLMVYWQRPAPAPAATTATKPATKG